MFLRELYIKMEKTITVFGDIEIKKRKFHQNKNPISINNIDIKKIVSNKASFGKKGFKCFIGCKDAKKLDLYGYFFQKWVYIEETLMKLNMSYLIKEDELLEKYDEIKNNSRKEFDKEPVYNEKYLKAKIKSCKIL